MSLFCATGESGIVVGSEMSWGEYTNLIVGILLLLVTACGFLVAVAQLRRTVRATERTAQSVAQTRLLTLLASLRDVEHALDASTTGGNREAAERATRDWRQLAAEVHGILKARPETDKELLDRLRVSLDVASRTKRELLDPGKSITSATEKLREEVAKICDEISLVGSDIQASSLQGEMKG